MGARKGPGRWCPRRGGAPFPPPTPPSRPFSLPSPPGHSCLAVLWGDPAQPLPTSTWPGPWAALAPQAVGVRGTHARMADSDSISDVR